MKPFIMKNLFKIFHIQECGAEGDEVDAGDPEKQADTNPGQLSRG